MGVEKSARRGSIISPEFLRILADLRLATDPLRGRGASVDCGLYGEDWLMVLLVGLPMTDLLPFLRRREPRDSQRV